MRHIALGLCVAVLLGTLVVPAWGASVAASTASAVSGPTGSTQPQLPPSPTGQGPISEENRRPGTTSWQSAALQQAGVARRAQLAREQEARRRASPRARATPGVGPQAPTPRAPLDWQDTALRGYADQTSINVGQSIGLHVGAKPPITSYNVDVYRMGWYGGTGARLQLTVPGLPAQNPAVPAPDPTTGLLSLDGVWPVSYTVQTDPTWVSGVYLAKLSATNTTDVAYIHFVVRNDAAVADLLYQVPITTYAAYNPWGGRSLYDFQSNGLIPATKVSFDRPHDAWAGAGIFFDGDFFMLAWLESLGYSMTYATSIDLQNSSSVLTNRKVFLSPWHDEYWSKQMRDNLTAARDAGKHLAFFDANNIYWKIRFEPSPATPSKLNRVVVCYKYTDDGETTADPLASDPNQVTVTWRDPTYVNKPENALLGVMYESNFDYGKGYDWVVQNATHAIYNGTGLHDGDHITGLIGYEYDKQLPYVAGQTPPGAVTVLANSPLFMEDGITASFHNASIYTAPSGALVFDAGTIQWGWFLEETITAWGGHPAVNGVPVAVDHRVERMTINILRLMGAVDPLGVVGDLNRDGIIDIRDYGIWRQNFGATACVNPADINADCLVDIRDYGIWRQNFGRTLGAAASPLPAAPPAPTSPGFMPVPSPTPNWTPSPTRTSMLNRSP